MPIGDDVYGDGLYGDSGTAAGEEEVVSILVLLNGGLTEGLLLMGGE